jgi:TPR repeat protein
MKAILRSGVLALAIMALAVPVNAGSFEDGETVFQRGEYATALKIRWPFLRPLAEQGDAAAQYDLGLMYHIGEGVSQDYAEAVKWWRMGAEQGHAKAQNNLGVMYGTGRGVPMDDALAYMWLNLAAARSFTGAATPRDIIALAMTPDQIAEAQRMAREWMTKHQQ